MEKKKLKPRGKPFPKGVSGHPEGRPPMPPEVKTLKQMNEIELVRLSNELLALEPHEIREVFQEQHPELRSITHVAFAAALLKTVETGQLANMMPIIERGVGKVKEKVEHSGKISLADIVLNSIDALDGPKSDE